MRNPAFNNALIELKIPCDCGRAGKEMAVTQPAMAEPQSSVATIVSDTKARGWNVVVQVAIVGIFVLALTAAFYFARAILMPIVAAIVIGLILAPLERRADRHRIPHWLFAIFVVGLFIAVLHVATLLLSGPISNWISRAPELTSIIKDKVQGLDHAFAMFQNAVSAGAPTGGDAGFKIDIANLATSALEILTPAVSQLVVFLAMVFFILLGQSDLRRRLILAFSSGQARLSAIRILNEAEDNLAGYVATVSVINLGLGIIAAIGVYFIGLPNPILWGVVAFLCNYLPYVGPAIVLCILFGVGLINFSSVGHALIAPIFYLALTTLEGHFITPNILGRRFTLNPLAVFLNLVFWTWLWGPVGSFLSVPILIVGSSAFEHLAPGQEAELPG
jgi:predicted PurR-regulated permease PerM